MDMELDNLRVKIGSDGIPYRVTTIGDIKEGHKQGSDRSL